MYSMHDGEHYANEEDEEYQKGSDCSFNSRKEWFSQLSETGIVSRSEKESIRQATTIVRSFVENRKCYLPGFPGSRSELPSIRPGFLFS